MDGMFDIFGYGMINPRDRDKRPFPGLTFPKALQNKSTQAGFDIMSMGEGVGPLDKRGRQILPTQPNYPAKANQLQKQATYKDAIMRNETGINQQNTEQLGFLQKLSNLAGVDMNKAAANWKDKGGLEGLMSNPAFTMGLAFLQAGANGKTLGQGALDNVVKAAGISAEFKDRIDARKQAPIQATAGDIAEVKGVLSTLKISEPNMWEKLGSWFKGEDGQANFDRAAEAVAIEYQKEVARLQEKQPANKPLVIDSAFKERIIKKLIRSGKIKHTKGWFGGRVTHGTISKKPEPMAKGGPIRANKAYVVGEEGPEVIIPHSSGNVLSTDDSQIFAMLLAANPQLQKVSKARAEKIMRSRFPEYFE
jgi:hypothetical protein